MSPRHSVECPGLVVAPAVSEDALMQFARSMATVLVPGDCIALRGNLGMGKTTFARALLRALLGDPAHEVPSPTFALRQDYASKRGPVAHLDLYRVSDPRELDELAFTDALTLAIAIVEWPERAEAALPADRFEIMLEAALQPDMRQVTLCGYGAAAERIRHLAPFLVVLSSEALVL